MPLGVGVDVSVRRGLDVVVLDERRRLVEPPRARQTADDLKSLLLRLQPDVVAIDSPPDWGISGGSRRAERDLRAIGLQCFYTPSDPAARENPFYSWMIEGHRAFVAAEQAGYGCFRGPEEPAGRALEVFPHGVAVALDGQRPAAGTTRRAGAKRRWRTAVLARAGVTVDALRTLDAVDAALAALMSVIVAEGGPWFWVGEPEEGCIVLPGVRPPGPYPSAAGIGGR